MALSLSRKLGESIRIGDTILITVVRIDGFHRVTLEIEAPRQARVDREEVYQKKQKEEAPCTESDRPD